MLDLFDAVKKQLSLKILLVLTVGVVIVMGVVIYFGIAGQRAHIQKNMTSFGRELKYMAYAGIKHPMSVGDSPSVEKQFLDVKEILKDVEMVICDFNQRIVFATHEDRINQNVSDFVHGKKALDALRDLLATGKPHYEEYYEEEVEGRKYLVTIHRMANTPDCQHCHGASRKVLGGLIVRRSTDETYAVISSLRNQTILISVLGIAAIIAITYFLLARLVARPVTELADKAERLARGDMSVSVPVRTKDAIGVLGESFNYMVGSIKDQIEFANSLKVAIADPFFMVDTNMVITYMNEPCAQLTGYSKEEAEGRLTCQEIFQSDICETTCPVRSCFETGGPVEGIRFTMTTRKDKKVPIMASASALRDADSKLIGGVEICRDITDVLEAERLGYIEKLYEKISSFNKELEREVVRRTMMLREKTLLLEGANRDLRELDRLKSSFLANMSHELRTPMNSIIGYTDLLLDGVDGKINKEQKKSLLKVENNAKHLLQLINDILDMSKIESGKVELDLKKINIQALVESVASTFEPAMTTKKLALAFAFADGLPHIYVDEDKIKQVFINLLSNAIKFTHQGGITIRVNPSEKGIKPGERPLFVQVSVEDTGIGIKEEDIGRLFDKFSQIDVSTIRQYEGTGLGLSIARGLVVLHKGVIWTESALGKGTKFHFTLPARREILEKPAEPIIETMMAEGLAECFEKPAKTFLNNVQYGGKNIKCWEYTHCGQTSCPAYGSSETRCWLIFGTHCKGTKVASYPEKVEFCKGCEIIERVILEDYDAKETERILMEKKIDVITKKTVLAIDDNPEIIELLTKYLREDYNVVGLLNGELALERAIETQPIAITLDVLMPKKDGWQVLQDLKMAPETQDIPVIILSIVDDKKQGFSLGAAEYLLKPIDKELLLRKLVNLEKITRIKKVLVVDRDPRTVELIGHVLDEAGYKIKTANNNEDAIQSIKVSRPDLIVLDLTLVDVNGFDLIEYIKSDEKIKTIPLIIISEKDLSDKDLEELDVRIQAILNKGILTEDDLLKELKQTIHKLDGS
ncbi:response regulator [Thermodesulfobacteriota bacterium]